MSTVYLQLDDDFVKVYESKNISDAQSVGDKLNALSNEPLYYLK